MLYACGMRLQTLVICLAIVCSSHWSGPDAQAADAMAAGTLSLGEVQHAIAQRYKGRILRIEVDTPRAHERRAGATLIYEVVLLTPQDAAIRIRLDAQAGAFLTIEGTGQVQARKRP